jgi:hypothetical protein
MEEKFNPLHAASCVFAKFWMLPDHQGGELADYSIFIEIKQSENMCYLIRPTKSGYLWKGILSGTKWKLITNFEELNENKDLLGAVHIKFRDKPIEINNNPLEPFPNYGLFWNYITIKD